jgi:hypothetical protein
MFKIPLSGRNPGFTSITRRKPKLLLLNKMDLADPAKLHESIELLKASGEKCIIPVDCRKQHCSNVRTIIPALQECLSVSFVLCVDHPCTPRVSVCIFCFVCRSSLHSKSVCLQRGTFAAIQLQLRQSPPRCLVMMQWNHEMMQSKS